MTGVIAAIPDRRISQKIAQKFGVTVEFSPEGKIVKHHYPYYDKDNNKPIGSKVRQVETKGFYATGNFDNVGLFGQQASREGGKYITITEGEADALAVSEMFDGKWPVVSIRSGAAAAAKDIKANLDWLETFDNVIICFDNDKAGQEAAQSVLGLFTPNKAKNVTLPLKDAGDMLKANKVRDFTDAWWDAKAYRPDGIVSGLDTWKMLKEQKKVTSIPYPWACLNDFTYGFRRKELVTFTSGSGMGKSQIMRELQHYLLMNTEDKIGILALEEDIPKTTVGIMSVEANKLLHKPDVAATVTEEEEYGYWLRTFGLDRIHLLDHFGSAQEDHLMSRIRYMAKGLDCKWIILDHLSIVVSSQENGDERKAIDRIMTNLRSIVQETGVGMFLISHLKRSSGIAHEDGGKISLSDLRGSQSIAQLSDMVIGLERNQQHVDEHTRNTTCVRVMKNRFVGLTGAACYLYYDAESGRMIETACPTEGNSEF
jgi:twinkle protein